MADDVDMVVQTMLENSDGVMAKCRARSSTWRDTCDEEEQSERSGVRLQDVTWCGEDSCGDVVVGDTPSSAPEHGRPLHRLDDLPGPPMSAPWESSREPSISERPEAACKDEQPVPPVSARVREEPPGLDSVSVGEFQ